MNIKTEQGVLRNKEAGIIRMMSSKKTLFAIGALALLFVSSVFADDVVVLTEDNFEKEVGQDRPALVEFYAPW